MSAFSKDYHALHKLRVPRGNLNEEANSDALAAAAAAAAAAESDPAAGPRRGAMKQDPSAVYILY